MPTTYCRHIRANGTRCQSRALRGEPLCYFHHHERRRFPNRRQRELAGTLEIAPAILHPLNPGPDGHQREPQQLLTHPYLPSGPVLLDFPSLEDRESIQIALSMVLNALGQGTLEPNRAGMMLYNLQVASSNARTLNPTKSPQTPLETVTHTVPTPDGDELAPDEDPNLDSEPKGAAAKMLMLLESRGL